MAVRNVAKELKPGWDTAKALNKEYMEKQLRRNPVAAPPGYWGRRGIFKERAYLRLKILPCLSGVLATQNGSELSIVIKELRMAKHRIAPVHPVSFLKNSWKTQKTMYPR